MERERITTRFPIKNILDELADPIGELVDFECSEFERLIFGEEGCHEAANRTS